MSVGVFARVVGLLGGLTWLAFAVLDGLGAPAWLVDALHWGGLALNGIALAGVGAGLVSSSAIWLRVIVAVCLPLLVWAVLETLKANQSDRWTVGAFGVLFALYCLAGLLRARRRRAPRHHGAHAA